MRKPDFRTAYLDSCTWIRYLARQDGWEVVRDLVEDRRLTLAVSPLLLVEAHGQPPRPQYDPAIEAEALLLLENPSNLRVEFDDSVALLARDLMRTHKLRSLDAIHLASAVTAEVDVLLTVDGDFPLSQRVRGIWIDRPYLPGGQPALSP